MRILQLVLKTRIVSIVLFFCMVIPGTATYMWMRHRRSTVRREIKHKLIAGVDKSELELLKFSEKEIQTKLKWKHSKEFQYKNHMYDIVKSEKVGDTTYYWCWWDYEETVLNKQLNQLLAKAFGKDPQKKERQNSLDNFFKSVYHLNPDAENSTEKKENNILNADYVFSSISAHLPPPVPPPKIAA